jgi:hypothetical protein
MNESGFTVAFNILDENQAEWSCLLLGIGPLLGLLFLPVLIKFGVLPSPRAFLKPFILLVCGLIFVSVFFFVRLHAYRDYRQALLSGQTSYVEGNIEYFSESQNAGGNKYSLLPHRVISFAVNGVYFSSSETMVSIGFNAAKSQDNRIQDGNYVRVWYIGNDILKLEIKTDAVTGTK